MKTVFVLGAGSSYDFGFPLGAKLIEEIAAYLGHVRDPINVSKDSYNKQEKLVETILGGQSQQGLGNPKFNIARKIAARIAFFPSIDAFIEASHVEDEQVLAKSMILKFISEAEGNASLLGPATSRAGTWRSHEPQFPRLQSEWLM